MKQLISALVLLSLSLCAAAQVPAPNYDESKIPPYTLPDLLTTSKGRPVRNVRTWERVRRPELLGLFEKEMFGISPGFPQGMYARVEKEVENAFCGAGTLKEVTLFLDAAGIFPVHLLIAVPKGAKGPVPAFLGINFCGNHATTFDPEVTIPGGKMPVHSGGTKVTEYERGANAHRWPYEYILSHGYAVVTYCREDIDPDFDDGFRNGVHGLMDGGKARDGSSWGTIAAWAWSLSRVLDYLYADPAIDADRVAVIGHSRLGKTALWAGATDPRFALVISNDSGCGGAALSRRRFGETVAKITTSFPHWFCKNFDAYGNNEDALPFDQHGLLALIAPRPLYVASASEDLWADPKGEYLSLYEASKVYALYGFEALGDPEPPGVEEPVVRGRTGYHIRNGKHNIVLYDWMQYVAFADRFLQ